MPRVAGCSPRGSSAAARAGCAWARRGSGCWAGRSRRRTPRAWPRSSRSTISRRVGASAVAVSAMRGTSGKRSCSTASSQIFGAEVVAPLRHAVRLVDREQRESAARQQLEEARRQQPLGRDVEQVELARRAAPARRARGAADVERRVEERGAHAEPGAAPSTWSCISAISGETTTPSARRRHSAGIW